MSLQKLSKLYDSPFIAVVKQDVLWEEFSCYEFLFLLNVTVYVKVATSNTKTCSLLNSRITVNFKLC